VLTPGSNHVGNGEHLDATGSDLSISAPSAIEEKNMRSIFDPNTNERLDVTVAQMESLNGLRMIFYCTKCKVYHPYPEVTIEKIKAEVATMPQEGV
jgi:hypothetical protein